MSETSVGDAIEIVGDGRFQYKLLLLCGSAFMVDAMEVQLLSYLSPCAQADWGLSDAEASTITSIVFLGEFFGAGFLVAQNAGNLIIE